MVGGAHHDDRDAQRVRDARDPGPAPAPVPPQHDPAPQGPPHMEARHGRVLIGEPPEAARRAGVRAPPAVRPVLRHGVDEPLARLQEPRRARGQEGEADEADERGDHQPGAQEAVVRRAALVDPDEDRRGDQVVERRVREVGGYAEHRVVGEEPVERMFQVYPQKLLYMEDGQPVVDGVTHLAPGEQPARRVEDVHHGYEGELGPPARPLPECGGVGHRDALLCSGGQTSAHATVRCTRNPPHTALRLPVNTAFACGYVRGCGV